MPAAQIRLDGLLVLDKPRGWTSHDVVARVRRLIGERRVGHAGTLDPLATGVLTIGIGQGTRVLEYVAAAGKEYRGTITLGVSTDTYDAEGRVTATALYQGVTRQAVERALAPFHGWIEQTPPRFSALKRAGRPLYDYARAGVEVALVPRRVRVDRLRLIDFAPPQIAIAIECGSGFYVRSLAHEVGQALGCGAHLTALERTRVGPFRLNEATSIERLERAAARGALIDLLWALDAPLRDDPAVILSLPHTRDLVDGKPLLLSQAAAERAGDRCRAYSSDGELVAILGRADADRLRPEKVFPSGRRGPSLPHEP